MPHEMQLAKNNAALLTDDRTKVSIVRRCEDYSLTACTRLITQYAIFDSKVATVRMSS